MLFLDCDDWLAPNALGVLLGAAQQNAEAGVVIGRALGVLPDGRRRRPPACDLSEPFAFLCAEGRFAIHSVLVKRDLVAAAGFDTDLKAHEDWDLWQRLARAGVRFVQVESDVAFYRLRADSLSRNVRQATADGLQVLRRGHAADPRVRTPAKAHAQGAPREALPSRQLHFLLWSAARDIAAGGDGVGVLAMADLQEAALEPSFLGALMASGMADVAVCDPAELGARWSELEPKLSAVFDALPGAKRQPRLKALALATLRANLDGGAACGPDIRLDRRRPLGESLNWPLPPVLVLKGPRGALGAVATPALGPMGAHALTQTLLAQARRLPLRAAAPALAPWRSSAFHLAAARRLADPRGLSFGGLAGRGLKALVRLRVRRAVAAGLQAALRARLVVERDAAGHDCPHTLALQALDSRAQDRATALPVFGLAQTPKPLRRVRGPTQTAIPILAWHRIAPEGAEALARYRVTPERFAWQIRRLRDEGFRSVEPEELIEALEGRRSLRGRPVMLTFDDAYVDFAEHAWPILKASGFGAVLFAPVDKLGGRADWDASRGEPAPLLDWSDIAALAREGVSVQSHSATHRPLTSLEIEDVYWEASWSKAAIERVVGRRPTAFSYPFGAVDPAIERAVEECGYRLGFGVAAGVCSLASDPMRLSRLEVTQADDPAALGRKACVR